MISVRIWAVASAVAGFIGLAVYVAVLVGEGNNTLADVIPWATAMLAASVLALAGAVDGGDQRDRITLLAAAAVFGCIGILTIFSVGVLFLVASVLSAVGYTRVDAGTSAPIA